MVSSEQIQFSQEPMVLDFVVRAFALERQSPPSNNGSAHNTAADARVENVWVGG